jgi:hypothetical protein
MTIFLKRVLSTIHTDKLNRISALICLLQRSFVYSLHRAVI